MGIFRIIIHFSKTRYFWCNSIFLKITFSSYCYIIWSSFRAIGGRCGGCAAAHPSFWLLALEMREFWPWKKLSLRAKFGNKFSKLIHFGIFSPIIWPYRLWHIWKITARYDNEATRWKSTQTNLFTRLALNVHILSNLLILIAYRHLHILQRPWFLLLELFCLSLTKVYLVKIGPNFDCLDLNSNKNLLRIELDVKHSRNMYATLIHYRFSQLSPH